MAENDGNKNVKILGAAAAILVAAIGVWFFASGSSLARVTGTVKLDNEPVAEALVVFIRDDEKTQGPVVSPTNERGDYQLLGNEGEGILPGKYHAVVTKMTMPDGTIPQGNKLALARQNGLLVNSLPKEYEERSTTPLHFDVHPGRNTIDLELKKKQ